MTKAKRKWKEEVCDEDQEKSDKRKKIEEKNRKK